MKRRSVWVVEVYAGRGKIWHVSTGDGPGATWQCFPQRKWAEESMRKKRERRRVIVKGRDRYFGYRVVRYDASK